MSIHSETRKYEVVVDRVEAIEKAIKMANKKDINENIDYNICGRDLLECVNKILEKEK